MNSETKRNGRINTLYQKAITGKYNWKELSMQARAMGVSEPTVKSYIDAVRQRLIKSGRILA